MKHVYTSVSAAVLAISFAAPALAADVYNPGSSKDAPVSFDAPKVSWSGLYIGGAIGYGNANHDLTVNDYFKDFCSNETTDTDFDPFDDGDREDTLENIGKNLADSGYPDWLKLAKSRTDCATRNGHVPPTGDANISGDYPVSTDTGDASVAGDSREVGSLDGLNSTGIVGDIRLGYDQQVNRFIIGIFGSYGLSSMEAEGTNTLFGDSFTLERGDDWSIGARAGVLVNDRTLLYILAAYTQTEYDLSFTQGDETSSKTTTFDGVTVGGGVEFALASNVFLGIEGTHTFYGSETIFDTYDSATNVGQSVEDDLGETKIMGTLKLKLNTGLFGN